jgi:hypothetical protein
MVAFDQMHLQRTVAPSRLEASSIVYLDAAYIQLGKARGQFESREAGTGTPVAIKAERAGRLPSSLPFFRPR